MLFWTISYVSSSPTHPATVCFFSAWSSWEISFTPMVMSHKYSPVWPLFKHILNVRQIPVKLNWTTTTKNRSVLLRWNLSKTVQGMCLCLVHLSHVSVSHTPFLHYCMNSCPPSAALWSISSFHPNFADRISAEARLPPTSCARHSSCLIGCGL